MTLHWKRASRYIFASLLAWLISRAQFFRYAFDDIDRQTRSASLRSTTYYGEELMISNDKMKKKNPPQPLVTTSMYDVKVSYVTTFWAKIRRTEMHPHRQEVEAALLANIYNPHFDQVVVFLDREFVKGSEVCHHFRIKMKNLSLRLFSMTEDEADKFLWSKLTCVDVYSGQPTYYQMFKNAVSDYVTGDIVVMANADQVFDETMAYARHLNPEVLAAIGTRGYNDLISADADYYYKEIVGREHPQYLEPANMKERAPDNCINIPGSVDTWIFHKNKLRETLRPEPFQRRNRGGQVNWFYMNEMGAENAAMWALNECYQFQSYYNACDKIHSWHFHLTSKTHHSKGWTRVPPSYRNPLKDTNRCARGNCFLSSIPLEEERE